MFCALQFHMPNHFLSFLVLEILLLPVFTWSAQKSEPRCDYLPSSMERAVLDELNLARQDPAAYAFHLEDLETSYEGVNRRLATHHYLTTKEGLPAVQEAVEALKRTASRAPLTWDPCLSLSAADHVRDTGPSGITGHESSKGESFLKRVTRYLPRYKMIGENIDYGTTEARGVVVELIIDDGVPDRGHRHNIFEPRFNHVGIACGDHATFGSQCVIDFARE